MIILLPKVHRINVTAQSGMLSKKPHALIASIISCGKVACVAVPKPADDIMVDTTPCIILNIAVISSKP